MVSLRQPARPRRRVFALGALQVVAWTVILYLFARITHEPVRELASGLRRPYVDDGHPSSAAAQATGKVDAAAPAAPAHAPAAANDTTDLTHDPLALMESALAINMFNPMQPNVLPISDITVGVCMVFRGCTVEGRGEDHSAGRWVRLERPVDPDLAHALGGGLRSQLLNAAYRLRQTFVFYRRSRALGGRRVVDVRLVQDGRDAAPSGDDWHRVETDVRQKMRFSQKPPVHLYYRTERGPRPGVEAITELDVVYGHNAPWPGFRPVGRIDAERTLSSTLLARRTPHRAPRARPPTFRRDGSFTILQLADLHFSVNEEACRDVQDVGRCRSHNDTLALVDHWLDAAKPDLVVFTGDQLNGQHTSWDEKSVLPLWLEPIVRRRLPWAAIFGNHDSESGFLTRYGQVLLLQQYPYSLVRAGPAGIHGEGNFDVPVRAPDGTELLTLWFLDSGAHPGFEVLHPLQRLRYDWVRHDQVRWLLGKSREKPHVPRPYKGQAARRRERPPGIAFVHIPVPEAFDEPDRDAQGRPLSLGERKEAHTLLGAQLRRGMFRALVKQRADEKDAAGVRLLVHGHMHNNEDCRRVQGIWLCFGGGASYAGYGKLGFERRSRVLRIGDWGESIRTWHLYDHDTQRHVDELELR